VVQDLPQLERVQTSSWSFEAKKDSKLYECRKAKRSLCSGAFRLS